MSAYYQSVMFRRSLAVAATMFLVWLPYYGGTWLVRHDPIYYKLGDPGCKWLTDLAEMAHFVGPIPFLGVGLILGIVLAFTLPVCRPMAKAS